MVESDEFLDFLPNLSMQDDYKITPLNCWQNVCLSDIWIPSSLLPTRKNPRDTRAAQGIFHTLQKKDHTKRIETFSVYSDSDCEYEEEEIYLSDSEEETPGLDTFSSEKTECTTHTSVDKGSAVTTNSFSLRNKHSTKGLSLTANDNCDYKHEYSKNAGKLNSKLKSFTSLNNLSLIDAEKSTQPASTSDKVINSNQNEERVKSLTVTNTFFNKSAVTQKTYKSSKNSEDRCKTKEHVEIPTRKVNNNQIHPVHYKEKNQDSLISLHEILDNTVDIDMRHVSEKYTTTKKHGISEVKEGFGESSKKRSKKEKKKKKTAKAIGLGEFLEDYDEADRQQDYCNDYLRKVLAEQNKDDAIQMRNPEEFPDLKTEEFNFIQSQKEVNKSKTKPKTFAEIFSQNKGANESQSVDASEGTVSPFGLDTSFGKIAIENIPHEVHHEDVHSFLSGYGKIKNFLLEKHGHFLKAVVEIDLMCDIDWIIECLNGTEPFGDSSKTLKCYKL